MKIAHVVTLVSVDGAFGGPVSVARGQCVELARRGHQVTLFAGWDGKADYRIPGVDVRFHRVRRVLPAPGFSGLLAPGLISEFRRVAPTFDVAHVHLARDLITLSAAEIAAVKASRLVTQTHGMVMPDRRTVGRLTDLLSTRRVLAKVDVVTVLTEIERAGLEEVARGPIRTELLPNGIALGDQLRADRPRGDHVPLVLFCARLHPRKRVLAFARMAKILLAGGIEARFAVAGPDEGDLAGLRAFLGSNDIADRVEYLGALPPHEVRPALAAADVYVLPSEREPFPMTLLEAMAEGTPAVITDGCMIAPKLAAAGGPIVTDGTPEGLARAVREILGSKDAAARIGDHSRALIESDFSISAVVDQLEQIYRR